MGSEIGRIFSIPSWYQMHVRLITFLMLYTAIINSNLGVVLFTLWHILDRVLFAHSISLWAELFTTNMVWGVNMQALYTIARSFNNMSLDFSIQCTDAMLEDLSSIITQTCCPLCGNKKLNNLDYSKKFQFRIESEKIMETSQRLEKC